MLITFLFALFYFIIILRINYRKETMYDINYIIKTFKYSIQKYYNY